MRLLAQHTRAGHVPSHVSSSGFDHGCGASMLRLAIARTEIGAPLAQSVPFVRLRVCIWYSTHALVMYQVRYETSLRPTNLYEARSGVRLGARRGGRRRVAARPFQLRNLVRSYSSAQAGWLGHSRWSCTNPHGSSATLHGQVDVFRQ